MDFGLVGKLVRSNSATAASNNGGSLASETDLRLYGSAFLDRDSRAVEDELPPAKAARISPCGGAMARVYLQECYNGGVSTPRNASIAAFPFVRSSSGPFTPSQWMELEHQALIYKYITANVPIPSYLLTPIRKALHSSSGVLSCFSLQTPNPRAVGWLGLSKADPEPGRCRRTDGKKWRCSRDAVADHKYCERHMNRGRHRSRKHVEPQPKPLLPAKTTIDRCLIAAYSELGSDSLLNSIAPVSSRNRGDLEDETKSELPLRHFIDEWPKNQLSLSRESEATQMGLCVGTVVPLEQIQRHNSWVPISWEPSEGGPLGEALHRTSECKSSKDNSSTLGVLRGAFGSLTSSIGPGAESSNGLIAPGLILPSLPAL